MSICLLISIVGILNNCNSQDNFTEKVLKFKKTLDQADTLTSDEASGYNEDGTIQLDSTFDINKNISLQLTEILNDENILNVKLDSILKHPFLNISKSEDKRLWIFSWYSNNGGTMSIFNNIIFYRTKNNKTKYYMDFELEDHPNSFCSNFSKFTTIYKLPSIQKKDLYICFNRSNYCSTCFVEGFSVFELTQDSISFMYPAFMDENNKSACYGLEYRVGSVDKFEYDSTQNIIHYSYTSDDITPISTRDKEKPKRIKGYLKWDGVRFKESYKIVKFNQVKR